MKNLFQIFAFVLFVLPGISFAGDFKSVVITDTNPTNLHVSNDQFLVIRNFTQDLDPGSRGLVTAAVLPAGPMTNVLVAAFVDSSSPPEIINNIVIAGPANISATCPTDATCFLTYRKESN